MKDIHIMLDQWHYMIANSRYSQIAGIQMLEFCRDLYLIDKSSLSSGDLDVILANTMGNSNT